MKEQTLNRINFMVQSHKGFTYKMMAIAFGAWFVFLLLIFVSLSIRSSFVKGSLEDYKKDLTRAERQKEEQIKMVEAFAKQKGNVSMQGGVAAVISARPKWSLVLKALTDGLPAQIWLDSVDIMDGKGVYRINIKGKAKSHRILTGFVMRLDSSAKFHDTSLVEEKIGSDGKNALDFQITSVPNMEKF